MQERGLNQSLLARGQQEDLTCLLDQLGNFQFKQITQVRQDSEDPSQGEPLRSQLDDSLCY